MPSVNTVEIGRECANTIIRKLRKEGYDASEYEEYKDVRENSIIDCVIRDAGSPRFRIEIKCRNLPKGIIGSNKNYIQFKFYHVDRVDYVICHFIGYPLYLWTIPRDDFRSLAPNGSLTIASMKRVKELQDFEGFRKLPH